MSSLAMWIDPTDAARLVDAVVDQYQRSIDRDDCARDYVGGLCRCDTCAWRRSVRSIPAVRAEMTRRERTAS